MAKNLDNSGDEEKKVKRVLTKRKAPPATIEPVSVLDAEPDAPAADRSGFFSLSLSRGSVRYADVTTFLRQLIMLLESGTSILKALKTLSNRGDRPSLRALVADIAAYVEAGNPLWMAFDRYPRHFDTVFVSLIKASEASGTLTTVLRRLVDYRGKREMLRKRVRGAMVYPVLLVIACFGALTIISSFVIPVFADFFSRAGLDIPAPTRMLLFGAVLVRLFWWLPIVVLLGLVLGYQLWYVRNPLRRLAADRAKLRIPIIGPIIHKNAIVEMCQTMALLLRSGLSMMSTLALTRNAIHNRAVAESLQGMRNSVEQGGGLEEPMRKSDVMPAVVTDMFVTGEESGRVDAVAEQIANIYEEEVEIAVTGLGEALQPVFTIVIGIAVLILFVALFLPMVNLIDQLGGAAGG